MSSVELSETSADFGLDLLRQVGDAQPNVFLSPLSIVMAMAMTYAGSSGNTAQQIKDVVFKGAKDDKWIHSKVGELMKVLNEQSDDYTLNIANRLYSQKDSDILDQYIQFLSATYHSDIKSVNFAESESARHEINKWVEEKTKHKITNLIASGVLTALTRLVIVNAIYFKGDWANKFEEKTTLKKTFYSALNKEIQVDMMRQQSKFLYGDHDELQVLGMPYKGNDLAMFVLLPKEQFGLEAVVKKLTGKQLLNLISQTGSAKVKVEMPKFRLESEFSLGSSLAGLGMGDMFDQSKADFTKITGGKDLYVSEVVHKAYIEVNEEGSEAAAASAVVMNFKSRPLPPVDPPKFIADHPFFFVIVDKRTNALLFAGHFTGK